MRRGRARLSTLAAMQQPEQPTFRQLPMYDKLIYKYVPSAACRYRPVTIVHGLMSALRPSEPFSLLSSRALTIGDVDNDRDLELVLGTTTGDLFIIKHDQPWRSYSGLQTVRCPISTRFSRTLMDVGNTLHIQHTLRTRLALLDLCNCNRRRLQPGQGAHTHNNNTYTHKHEDIHTNHTQTVVALLVFN